eukprot:750625-Hanusia_phi.AAC.2
MTTLAWCLQPSMREWSVAVVRRHPGLDVDYIQIDDGKTEDFTFDQAHAVKAIDNLLSRWSSAKRKLLLLDGILYHLEDHQNIFVICSLWRDKDWKNRRLAVLTSIWYRGDLYFDCAREEKFEEHLRGVLDSRGLLASDPT